VRVAARVGRFWLVLAVLLVLFGVSVAVAPGPGNRDAGQSHAPQHRVPVIGESASTAPSTYDDLQDWLRLSAGTLRAPSTALPNTWWAECPRATDGCALQGRLRIDESGSTKIAAATPTPQSTRAPPFA
jgi:hypothetical protein